jgi:very-short-patch-repair endonuclease
LQSIWVKVIRFTNKEIVENIGWVLEFLEDKIVKWIF